MLYFVEVQVKDGKATHNVLQEKRKGIPRSLTLSGKRNCDCINFELYYFPKMCTFQYDNLNKSKIIKWGNTL